MPKIKNETFVKRFYLFIVIIIFILSMTFFTLAIKFNENYFLQFSPDKVLKQTTLDKIKILQAALLVLSALSLLTILFFLFYRKPLKLFIKKHNVKIKNFSLLVGVLFAVFLIMEVALMIFLNEQTIAGGFGPGSLKFNKKYVHLNNDGIRDRDFSLEKPSDTFRIAVLGDSFTFGNGIKNINKIYPKILEKKLNAGGNQKYEVLNFALPGKDTEDEIEILKNKALKYDPDIVILGYVLNDFKLVDKETLKSSHLTIIPWLGFWLRNFFYTYVYFEIKTNRLLENFKLKDTETEIVKNNLNSQKNQEANRKLFNELGLLAKDKDIEVIVVIFPLISDFNNYQFLDFSDFIKNTSLENNFKVIDILEVYKDYSPSELIINKYDAHPNEFGHELAANYILEIFKKENIIP